MADFASVRVYKFLLDLVDPEMFGLAINGEIRREVLKLLELYK